MEPAKIVMTIVLPWVGVVTIISVKAVVLVVLWVTYLGMNAQVVQEAVIVKLLVRWLRIRMLVIAQQLVQLLVHIVQMGNVCQEVLCILIVHR